MTSGRLGRALAFAVLVLASCLLASCTRGEPELREGDRQQLRRVVAHDVRASKAMHAADEAVASGDRQRALAIIDADARPAIEEGSALAERTAPKTEWGRKTRDALAAVLRDRRGELPRYTEAVKSGEPEKMLSAMEAQAAIERRALAAVAGIDEGG